MCQGLIKVVLLLVAGFTWAGDVYRWQDINGKWHFDGRQSAPAYAEPFVAAAPLSVIQAIKPAPYKYVAVVDEAKKQKKSKASKSRKKLESAQSVSIDDREYHRVYCDKWRERLYRSQLGLRDHEGQAAYEHECILNVRW